MGGGTEDVEVGTQAISLDSVLIVNTLLSPSQRPLRASLTSSVSILMSGTGKIVQAILVAVFLGFMLSSPIFPVSSCRSPSTTMTAGE